MAISVKKGPKVKVVADIIEWPVDSGVDVLDIRTFVKTAKSGENFIATAKGVQIPIDEAEKFARRLLRMVKEYNEG